MNYLNDIEHFTKFVRNEEIDIDSIDRGGAIMVQTGNSLSKNTFFLDTKRTKYKKIPELATQRTLISMKNIIAMSGRYAPIYDIDTKELLFTVEEFLELRKRMSGIEEYHTGDYIFSENLYFDELDTYLNLIDDNFKNIEKQRNYIRTEINRVLSEIGICLDDETIELIDTGSTGRGTNIPEEGAEPLFDFDFIIRVEPSMLNKVRECLSKGFDVDDPTDQFLRKDDFRIRLRKVIIPGIDRPLDVDFSFVPEKEKYLSTEASIETRLDNMKAQNEAQYRLVLANIMYAKKYLKSYGVYKPSKGLPLGEEDKGGLGGIGIENWVLEHGGSFIDAATSFMECAEGKEYLDFLGSYSVVDYGKNHISVSKNKFPYDNYLLNNLGIIGYEKMQEALGEFLNLDKEKIHS